MSKGNNSKKTETALAVVSGGAVTDKKRLAALQSTIAEQIGLIHSTERENVIRRLFVGLGLQVIKGSLKHGEWLPWLKKNAPGGTQYRSCAYMMSAALAFVDKARVSGPDLELLPSGDFSLDLTDKSMRKLVTSAEKFVGDLTWGELLDAHGIKDAKKIGGARSKGDTGAAEEPTNEQLYLFARDEIGLMLTQAESLLVKENRLQHLAGHPEEVRGVVESLRALADKVEQAAKPFLKS